MSDKATTTRARPPQFSALASQPSADQLAAMLRTYADQVDTSTYAGAVERKYARQWAHEVSTKFGSGEINPTEPAPSRNGRSSVDLVGQLDEPPAR